MEFTATRLLCLQPFHNENAYFLTLAPMKGSKRGKVKTEAVQAWSADTAP
jgi:hypothetical protein